MGDFSLVLEQFFDDIMTRFDAVMDIVTDQEGFYAFLSYIWSMCIPSELITIFLAVVLIIFVFALVRHSKG